MIQKPSYYKSQAQLHTEGLGRSLARYKSMMGEMQQAKVAAEKPIAEEYGEVADIYKTGGEYGAGAKARVRDIAAENLAKSSAALVSTGMSSGSMATATRAMYGRDVTRGIQDFEDVRYERLGTALQAVAQAKEARGIRIGQAYSTTAQLAGSFQEPSMGSFANQEAISAQASASQRSIAKKSIEASTRESGLSRKAQTEAQRSAQAFQTSERKASEAFVSGQAARYKTTAATKGRLDTLKTYIK